MTKPAIRGTPGTWNNDVNATTWVVNFPADVVAGDILVAGTIGLTGINPTLPAPWVRLDNVSGSNAGCALFARTAVAGMGGGSVTGAIAVNGGKMTSVCGAYMDAVMPAPANYIVDNGVAPPVQPGTDAIGVSWLFQRATTPGDPSVSAGWVKRGRAVTVSGGATCTNLADSGSGSCTWTDPVNTRYSASYVLQGVAYGVSGAFQQIYDGGAWHEAETFIYEGATWHPADVHIYDNHEWVPVESAPIPPPFVPRFPGDPGLGGTYYGSSNEGTVEAFEAAYGVSLPLYRSYFQQDDNAHPERLAARATDDIANGRLPFMSTKVPGSAGAPNGDWAGVASGIYDAVWLNPLLLALKAVVGPKWLAVHHEPYGDGAASDWVLMNQHIRQRIDAIGGTNIALVGILNGYRFHANLASFQSYNMPVGSGVHIMGFDSYNPWNGHANATWRDVNWTMIGPANEIASWGYPTCLGEYGVKTDVSNVHNANQWMLDAWTWAKESGFCVALSYFNSGQNSPDGTWDMEKRPTFTGDTATGTTPDTPGYPRKTAWQANVAQSARIS